MLFQQHGQRHPLDAAGIPYGRFAVTLDCGEDSTTVGVTGKKLRLSINCRRDRRRVKLPFEEGALRAHFFTLEGNGLTDAKESGLVVVLCELHDLIDRLTMDAYGWPRGTPHGTGPASIGDPASIGKPASIGALAACWTLGELARGWVFTGFPWLSLAYAQPDGPLAIIAAGIGAYGLGGVVVAVAAALASIASWRARGGASVAIACGVVAAIVLALAGVGIAGASVIGATGPVVSVRLLQGNVEQGMKFDPQRALQAMNDYTDDVLAGDAQLTVLPETAWTTTWRGTPPSIRDRLFSHLDRTGGRVAIGLPEPASGQSSTNAGMLANAVVVRGPDGAVVGRYDKRQLVPFGEYVPPAFGWFVRMMNIPLGEFARGGPDQPPVRIGGQAFAFDICYEDLFPGLLRRQVLGGATVLVNVSNIAWFGDSHALGQHLNISRMRAIELGRPMLRATNTGMTASIDPSGRVLAALAPLTRGALDVEVRGTVGETPYARFGHWPAAAFAIAWLLAQGAWRRRAARKS